MVNRTALAALLASLAVPAWSIGGALGEAAKLSEGNAAMYDRGCSGGSCGAEASIEAAASGASRTGGLTVRAERGSRPTLTAEVPKPVLTEDKPGATRKPGFLKRLFGGKGLMYGLGGAAAGTGIGWFVGGPLGALIGALVGGLGGFFLKRMLAK